MTKAAFFGALCLFAAGPVGAQATPEPRTGSRIPANQGLPGYSSVPDTAPDVDFPVDHSRDILASFAQCSVKKHTVLAREVVLDTSHVAFDKAHLAAADPECLALANSSFDVTRLEISPFSLRAALADALIKSDLLGFDPNAIRFASPIPKTALDPADFAPKAGMHFSFKQLQDSEAKTKADLALIAYGECVVRKDPVGSHTLLSTPVNSDAELQALQALMPAFSGCLDIGQQFKASRLLLRNTLALNYYRLAFAPKVAQTEAQK